jgi:hypothetical protein
VFEWRPPSPGRSGTEDLEKPPDDGERL